MRIFSPSILYLSIWFLLNIGLTLLNKSLMVFYGFKFPVMLSFIHQAVSTFFSVLESYISNKKHYEKVKSNGISRDEFEKVVTKRILILSFLFTLNIVFGNASLRYCSIAFTQVVRAIIPMITMFFSVIFLNSKFTKEQVLSCIVVCIGVAFSCFGEINLTWTGLFITLAGCFLSSGKSISIKQTLSGQYELQSADLITRMSPIAAIEMFFLIFYKNEDDKIISPTSKYTISILGIFGAILSGVIAYFLNLSNFLATHHTSPLTVTIAGCVKQVVTIILSVLIFDKSLTLLNTIGIIITTIGSLWYSIIELKNKKKPTIEKEEIIDNKLGVDQEFNNVEFEVAQEEEDKNI